ncbi:MAG: hypothetical protein WED00_02995 [Aquisalimonadaceae bacterium]
MKRITGIYSNSTTLGESVQAFLPHPLPPAELAEEAGFAVSNTDDAEEVTNYDSGARCIRGPLGGSYARREA